MEVYSKAMELDPNSDEAKNGEKIFFCDWPMTNDHPLVVDHHGVNCLWTGYRDCAIRMQSGGGGGKDPEEVILIIIIIIIINNWENET